MKTLTFKIGVAAFCAAVATIGSPLLAQETEGESSMDIEMLQTEGGAPIIISSSSEDFGNGSSQSMRIVAASDSGGGMGGMFLADAMGGMGGMMGGGAFSMLSNKSVQDDLELVGEQLDKVNALRAEFGKEMEEQFRSLKSGDPAAAQGLGQRIMELKKEQKEKIESMLLPHQLDRLKQVNLQMQMNQQGTGRTLTSKLVAEALGIDKAQQKRIKERQKELKVELEERMAKLKEEIREKLLSELTSEQQEKLKELQGEKFEYKEPDFGRMIQNRIKTREKKAQENN